MVTGKEKLQYFHNNTSWNLITITEWWLTSVKYINSYASVLNSGSVTDGTQSESGYYLVCPFRLVCCICWQWLNMKVDIFPDSEEQPECVKPWTHLPQKALEAHQSLISSGSDPEWGSAASGPNGAEGGQLVMAHGIPRRRCWDINNKGQGRLKLLFYLFCFCPLHQGSELMTDIKTPDNRLLVKQFGGN